MNPEPVCPQSPGVTDNPDNTGLFARAARPVRSNCTAQLAQSDRLAQSIRRPNVPTPLIFMLEGTIQYVGAGLVVGLFTLFVPLIVAWLRSVIARVILVT